MTCKEIQPLIALYVSGDWPAGRVRTIEHHIGECVKCRDLAGELEEGLNVLKSLRAEAVESIVYAEVRQRVLAAVERQQEKRSWWGLPAVLRSWPWRYALIGCTLIAVMVGLLWMNRSPERREEVALSPIVQAPGPHRTESPVAPTVAQVNGASREVQLRQKRIPSTGRSVQPSPIEVSFLTNETFVPRQIEPLRIVPMKIEPPQGADQIVVNLVTPDPDIVIIWFIDQKHNGG